jgi:hypothetical protein
MSTHPIYSDPAIWLPTAIAITQMRTRLAASSVKRLK